MFRVVAASSRRLEQRERLKKCWRYSLAGTAVDLMKAQSSDITHNQWANHVI